ncbi:MAG: acyltransferase family protein [Pirellulales bacterium]
MANADPYEARSHVVIPTTEPPSPSRMAYLDNLRAIAMLLGVYLHAALAYAAPANSVWLATDGGSSRMIDFSIWWIHLFRMSLFFAIAGYLGKMVFARKGVKQFIVGRLVRIVLPFAVFYPLLLGAMTAVFVFALTYLESPQGLMGMIAEAYEKGATEGSLATEEAQKPGTMHLWFLYYLAYFTGLGIVGSLICHSKNRSILRPLRTAKRFLEKMREWGWHHGIALCIPVLWVPAVMAAGMPLPAPESWVPTWWPFVFYGSFYLGGWILFGNEEILEPYRKGFLALLGFGLILLVPYYVWMPNLDLSELDSLQKVRWDWQSAMVALMTAYLSLAWTLFGVAFGGTFFECAKSRASLYRRCILLAPYLIHLPIVIFLQTLRYQRSGQWPSSCRWF